MRVLLCTCVLALTAAESVKVGCTTTAGAFTVTLKPSYSPLGVARFLALVDSGFFTEMLLYRVMSGFLVQFGVAADPAVQAKYQEARFMDEPNKVPFRAGTLSFAGNGADSRSCHLFVALEPNGARLGNAKHETTLGHLDEEGIDTFEKVVKNHQSAGYGDTGSLQSSLVRLGNAAASKYPKLDRIIQCARLKDEV
jgi:cyclophilin family peptidyl-prolyl cis-trans isomerase